jgi:8-oxo-dGTP pyrophosphatase MutT (NUDIX family)
MARTKLITCGVLLLDAGGELLLGHATGGRYWDIFKGVGEPGETPRGTAVREVQEECGLIVDEAGLLDLGLFSYRPEKDLQLYASLIERIDPSQCRCTSFFRDAHGRLRPEMDGFMWIGFDEVPTRCAKSMSAVLTQKVSLAALLERLTAKG